MILLLVRHGLTAITGKKLTGRLPGFDLSYEGRGQAEATSTRLRELPVRAVYSSPVERCVQTAEVIASPHGLEVVPEPMLSEIDYGRWQGKSYKTLHKDPGWKKLRARPADFRFPGGETIREAQARGVSAVEELRHRHEETEGVVVVCSHCDMIKLLIAAYLGMGIDTYDRINVSPASVTAVALSDGAPIVLNVNDTGGYDGLRTMLREIEQQKADAASDAAKSKEKSR